MPCLLHHAMQAVGTGARVSLSGVRARLKDLWFQGKSYYMINTFNEATLAISDSTFELTVSPRLGNGKQTVMVCSSDAKTRAANSQFTGQGAGGVVTGFMTSNGLLVLHGVEVETTGVAMTGWAGATVLASKCSVQLGPDGKGIRANGGCKLRLSDSTVEGGTHGIFVSGPCARAWADTGICSVKAACTRMLSLPQIKQAASPS